VSVLLLAASCSFVSCALPSLLPNLSVLLAVFPSLPPFPYFSSPGFLLTRFFTAGVLSKETRRGLVLVTKLLQHLANGMTSFREAYMTGLDSFVAENSKIIEALCDKFAVCIQ
jgi:hypothetical protein